MRLHFKPKLALYAVAKHDPSSRESRAKQLAYTVCGSRWCYVPEFENGYEAIFIVYPRHISFLVRDDGWREPMKRSPNVARWYESALKRASWMPMLVRRSAHVCTA